MDADHLGRRTAQETEVVEILVLGNDDQRMLEGMAPDKWIGSSVETDVADMAAAGKNIRQQG